MDDDDAINTTSGRSEGDVCVRLAESSVPKTVKALVEEKKRLHPSFFVNISMTFSVHLLSFPAKQRSCVLYYLLAKTTMMFL